MNDSWYDVAQVCPNGHVANSSTLQYPQWNQAYCDKCGEKTITQCQKCNSPIVGELHVPGIGGFSGYTPPAYCQNCGSSFPWTQASIEAAIELSLDGGKLQGEEIEQLKQSINDVVKDTPKTQLAATRLKRLLVKLGKGTADAVHDILVDVASETAKKIIWPEQ